VGLLATFDSPIDHPKLTQLHLLLILICPVNYINQALGQNVILKCSLLEKQNKNILNIFVFNIQTIDIFIKEETSHKANIDHVCLFVCLPISLSVCVSVYLSACLSVCLPI